MLSAGSLSSGKPQHFDPFQDTNPDALSGFFSSASTASRLQPGIDGFGPGDYSGGYTGEGDRVYWGPSDGGDFKKPPPAVLNANTNPLYDPHIGSGYVVDAVHTATTLATTDSSGAPIKSTGPQPSARTGAVAPPSSVVAEGSSAAPTDSGRSFLGSHSEDAGSSAGWGERSEMSGNSRLDAANDTVAAAKARLDATTAKTDAAAKWMDDWQRGRTTSTTTSETTTSSSSRSTSSSESTVSTAPSEDVIAGAIELTSMNRQSGGDSFIGSEPGSHGGTSSLSGDSSGVSSGSSGTDGTQGGSAGGYSDAHTGSAPPGTDAYSIYSGDSDISRPSTNQPSTEAEATQGTETGSAPAAGEIEMLPIRPTEVANVPGAELRGPGKLGPAPDVDFGLPELPPVIGDYDADMSSPLLLDDVPAVPPGSDFSWDGIDWDMVPEAKSAMSEWLGSDAAADTSFLGSDGIGQELGLMSSGGFSNFVQARMLDLGIGTVLMPFFSYIDRASGTPWVSRAIQGTMAVAGLVMTGDPFGVIAAPICWGMQEIQRQDRRKLENDKPDANFGKRYGFVREGKKWYPAFLTRAERDEGWLGSDRTQIKLSYGKDLRFKRQKGTGKMIPYFDEGAYRQKDFHVWDNEVDNTNEQSSGAWRDQADPLRDFYFLDDKETDTFLGNLGGGDTVSKYLDDRDHVFTAEEQTAIKASQKSAFDMMLVHDDMGWGETWEKYGTDEQKAHYGQYTAYTDTLLDVGRGLETWQDYLTSEPGNIYTTHQDENQYSGAKAFRRTVNDSGYLGYQGELKGQMSRPMGTTLAEMQDNKHNGVSWEQPGKHMPSNYSDEAVWLGKEWFKARGVLFKSQKRAGEAMHFDKVFANPDNLKEDAPIWMKSQNPEDLQQNAWRMYIDGSWEIGDTSTDESFAEALRHIEASGDSGLIGTHDYRSADQRDYLANKAYVRYLSNKLDSMGLGEAKTEMWKEGHSEGSSSRSYYRQETERNNLSHDTETNGDYEDVFAFDPEYSYADDFAKWGYHTKPTSIWIDGKKQGLNTMDPDFALAAIDKPHYTKEPEWLRDYKQYYTTDLDPDQVAGRYTSKEEFDRAMAQVAQEDPPEQPDVVDAIVPWDVWGEGVPQGELPWDVAQGANVDPAHKTPGSVYNPKTGNFEHKSNPKPAVEPHKEAALPTIPEHESSAVFNTDYSWTPEAGSDFPDGFFWDGTNQEVISEDGERFKLGDPKMWDAYWKVAMPFESDDEEEPEEPKETATEWSERMKREGAAWSKAHPALPVEAKVQKIPDASPEAGAHVHEEAYHDHPGGPLPLYMQQQHEDRHFQHSSAPEHLPPAHIKTI